MGVNYTGIFPILLLLVAAVDRLGIVSVSFDRDANSCMVASS